MDYVDLGGRPQMGNARCNQGHPLWLKVKTLPLCW